MKRQQESQMKEIVLSGGSEIGQGLTSFYPNDGGVAEATTSFSKLPPKCTRTSLRMSPLFRTELPLSKLPQC